MTYSEVVVRVPNAVVLIGDPLGNPPESMNGRLVAETSSCVAVGTLSEADGATTIRVGSVVDAVDTALELVFDGTIEASSGRLAVSSVSGENYIERRVAAGEVRLRILVNDPREPDQIRVVV